MEEIFLNEDMPGFKETEAKLKANGYVEKKFTKSTKDEIEGAFKRHLLKQMNYSLLNTPEKIRIVEKTINDTMKSTLYKEAKNGAKILHFKMYIPGVALQKRRNEAIAAFMNEEEEIEELFAPENYPNIVKKLNKANENIQKIMNNVRHIKHNSGSSNFEKILNKTRKVQKKISNLEKNVRATGNVSLQSRARSTMLTAKQIKNHTQEMYNQWAQPYEELSNLLEKVSITNRPVRKSKMTEAGLIVIDKDFIEDILEIENENENNNNNNNNNNNEENRNKMGAKALVTGRSATDIKFLKDIVHYFMKHGMEKDMAIRLGVVLGNLPREEFNMIKKQFTTLKSSNISSMEIAQQLAQYLVGKLSGGRRRTHRRRK